MSTGIAASLHCVANMFANTPADITQVVANNTLPDTANDFFESKKDFWLKLRLEGVEGA
jgi:hypothetical protein